MPQLDLFSILNQFLWGLLFFLVFYFLITFFFIPSLFTSMYARRAFTDSRSGEVFHLVASIFFAHAYVFLFADELASEFQSLLEQIMYSKAISSSVYSSSFELEFQKAYEFEELQLN
jgi:hypothetical protein